MSGRRRRPTRSMPSEKSAGTTSISWLAHGSLEVPVPAAMSRMRSPGLRVDGLDDGAAPQPVLAEREDVVGDVVLLGDGVEHRRDVDRLLVQLRTGHALILAPAARAALASRVARPTRRGGRAFGRRVAPMSTLPAPGAPSPSAGPTVVVRTVPLDAADSLLAYLPSDRPHDELLSWVRRGEGLVGWGTALTFEAGATTASARPRRGGARSRARGGARRGRAAGHRARCFGSFPFAADSPSPPASSCRRRSSAAVTGRGGSRPVSLDPQLTLLETPSSQAIPSRRETWRSPTVRVSPAALRACGRRGRAAHRRGRGRQGRPRPRPRARRHRAPSTPAGCCAGSPSATRTPGCSRSPASSAPPRSCSCAATRASSPPGCSPGRSAGPATTRRTSRSPPRWPGRRRTSRSTSTPSAPSPRPCPALLLDERARGPFVLHLPNVMHLATDVAAVGADDASSLTLAASLHPSAAVGGTPTAARPSSSSASSSRWTGAATPGPSAGWTPRRRRVGHRPAQRRVRRRGPVADHAVCRVRHRRRLGPRVRGGRVQRQAHPDARRAGERVNGSRR